MSDVITLGKKPAPTPAPAPDYKFPYTVQLPTRYYNRLAIEETARDFGEIAKVDVKVGDGVFEVTVQSVDAEAGPSVVDEFLNHCLYRSATAGEAEVSR